MAVAAWMVWRQLGIRGALLPLGLFIIQLALNTAWTWLFFGKHRPGAALIDIAVLWLVLIATIVAFWGLYPVAGQLLIPYLVWVTFLILASPSTASTRPLGDLSSARGEAGECGRPRLAEWCYNKGARHRPHRCFNEERPHRRAPPSRLIFAAVLILQPSPAASGKPASQRSHTAIGSFEATLNPRRCRVFRACQGFSAASSSVP
jgi:hypothetical protein